MRAEDCGLAFIATPNWVLMQYFTSYEVLPEFMKAKKRGDPPIKTGEFIRITLPSGETRDIHDFVTKDQYIPAIDHIKRYPK